MPRRYSMAKRAPATERTRRRIEAALIRLLGSRPYNGITIVEIAAEAAVSPRTVQRHYRTKDDILAACSLFPDRVVGGEWNGQPARRFAADDVRTLVGTAFSVYQKHGAETWAAYMRSVDVPELRETLLAGLRVREALIDEVLARWPDAWARPPAAAKRLLLALTSFPAWRGFTDFERYGPAEAAAEVSDILCRLLLQPSS